MTAFDRQAYETLLYSLSERYHQVVSSTLRLYNNSATAGIVRSSMLELRIFEYIDLVDGEILDYSYTILPGRDQYPLV